MWKKLSHDHRTSSLEAFHSVILSFMPKNVVFRLIGMLCKVVWINSIKIAYGICWLTCTTESLLFKIWYCYKFMLCPFKRCTFKNNSCFELQTQTLTFFQAVPGCHAFQQECRVRPSNNFQGQSCLQDNVPKVQQGRMHSKANIQ